RLSDADLVGVARVAGRNVTDEDLLAAAQPLAGWPLRGLFLGAGGEAARVARRERAAAARAERVAVMRDVRVRRVLIDADGVLVPRVAGRNVTDENLVP